MNLNKTKIATNLAENFEREFKNLPVKVLPNNDIIYNEFLIKLNESGLWELYNLSNHDLISKFYLKSCALMAANYYGLYLFNIYRDIKYLDKEYNRHKNDSIYFKHYLYETTDQDQKVIFLNRLECCSASADYYKSKISQLFKRTFV